MKIIPQCKNKHNPNGAAHYHSYYYNNFDMICYLCAVHHNNSHTVYSCITNTQHSLIYTMMNTGLLYLVYQMTNNIVNTT